MSKNKMTLYDISNEMDSLFTMLVLDEEDQREFDDRWGALEIQFSDKMLACNHVVRNWDGYVKALDEEIDRLRTIRDKYKGARKKVLGLVQGVISKLDDGRFTDKTYGVGFRLQKNSQPAVEIEDMEALAHQHPEFVITEVVVSADKKAIAKHFKETGEIPDGTDVKQGNHVRLV